MPSVGSYFTRQIQEIADDKALRAYGAALTLLTLLSGLYFLEPRWSVILSRGTEAICWPMWDRCETWRFLDATGIRIAIGWLVVFSMAGMALFAWRRTVGWACLALLVGHLLKLGLIAMDYRLRMNHHLMAFWVTLAFLFLPAKRRVLRVMVMLFYFWAGTLKLNPEWLSGSALYAELWFFHGAAIPWACGYVVVLELVMAWGLLFDGRWWAWAAWAQIVLFHTFSFPIVGFYYPTLMYAILTIYPLCWLSRQEALLLPALLLGKERRTLYILVLVFSAIQLLPKLIPGDSAVTGEGRLFALDMFDARTECEVSVVLKKGGETTAPLNLRLPLPIRLHCDPVVYLSRVRHLCDTGGPGFELDWVLRSRRWQARELDTIVDIKDFCGKRVRYAAFGGNAWIRKGAGAGGGNGTGDGEVRD